MLIHRHLILMILILTFFSTHNVLAQDEESTENENSAPPCKFCPEDFGWSGWIETGLGYQNEDDYHFGRYSGDVDNGARVNIDAQANYMDEDGIYVESVIEDLGLDSRHLQFEMGNQGVYKFRIAYDQIPNYRKQSAYSPYLNAANGTLNLPADWVPGATTFDMPSLAGDLKQTSLKTERDRSSASFSYFPDREWEIATYVRHEEKDGTKDLGASFGFTQTVILPQPINYETDDIGVTLDYSGRDLQAQLGMSVSQFNNNQDRINWQNPFEDTSSSTGYGSISSDSPDNEFSQISAILGYQLSSDTRVSARLASSSMTQNEDFLPYTINPSITTTGIPANSLDGKVDTTLASLQINSRPMDRLRLDASYTHSDRDNKTSIYTFDPVTTDQAGSGERQNRPYSFKQNLLRLKSAYRFINGMHLSVGYDDDKMDRSYTNIEQTNENTLWGKLKLKPLDQLQTTLKYSHASRDTSAYKPLSDIDPLFDYPSQNYYNNELLRMYSMADRKRDKYGFDITYSPLDILTLGLDLEVIKDDYNQMYLGLQQADGLTYTASLSYMFDDTLNTSLYYSYDKLDSDQKGSEKAIASDAENFWVASDSNLTNTIGVAINWIAIEDTLDITADLTYSSFTGKIGYQNNANLPDIKSNMTAVSLKGNYFITEEMTLKFEIRYESYDENNWYETGEVNSLPTLLSLGTSSMDNTTTLAVASLRYNF